MIGPVVDDTQSGVGTPRMSRAGIPDGGVGDGFDRQVAGVIADEFNSSQGALNLGQVSDCVKGVGVGHVLIGEVGVEGRRIGFHNIPAGQSLEDECQEAE
jgi:hypothetical protein